MIKNYKLKIFGNKGKLERLDRLICYYRDEINRKIHLFWHFKEVKKAYPPKEYMRGGRIINQASNRAWSIVKSAKKLRRKEPFFLAEEIDISEILGRIIPDLRTKEYDLWLIVRSLEPRNRLKLPCKRYKAFNLALEQGKLRKSFKLKKIRGKYYAFFFVEFPEKPSRNSQVIGVDVGLNHPAVTSDGNFFGDDLRDLRIRTKWRHYKKGLSASKQGLNRIAKEIIQTYKGWDFAVEKLSLKGKRNRSHAFRRNNQNWNYAYLMHKLGERGKQEGFRLFLVSPAYTSQRCPECGKIEKANRKGENFRCIACDYTKHADVVGAINLAKEVAWDHSCPQSTTIVS